MDSTLYLSNYVLLLKLTLQWTFILSVHEKLAQWMTSAFLIVLDPLFFTKQWMFYILFLCDHNSRPFALAAPSCRVWKQNRLVKNQPFPSSECLTYIISFDFPSFKDFVTLYPTCCGALHWIADGDLVGSSVGWYTITPEHISWLQVSQVRWNSTINYAKKLNSVPLMKECSGIILIVVIE